jgi:nucleoid-associated protein YgaU
MRKIVAFLSEYSGPAIGASILAVAAVGTGTFFVVLKPNDTVESVPIEVAMPAEEKPKTDVVVAKPTVVAETPTETVALDPIAPSIDEVRREADGLTILAGRGEPNAKVTLFVDQIEDINVTIGNDGAFAIVAFLEPSADAQVLTMKQQVGDVEIATADIILAPQAVVAKASEAEAEVAAEARAAVAADVVVEAEADLAVEVAVDVRVESEVKIVAEVAEPVTESKPTAEVGEQAVEPAATVVEEPTVEVAILKSDQSGVEVINRSSAPEFMSNVEIDTISYSDEGDVLLSGRAQSKAASVRIYLDNTAITTLSVDTSGRWRGDLPDVDTGVYTLRVDEVDVQGDVTSRVETPFKREAPEVLEAAAGESGTAVTAITVQKGATLWAIARDRYGDGTLFVRVFEANSERIKDPDLIYPGQVFDLPD